jgi:hypothetical protein
MEKYVTISRPKNLHPDPSISMNIGTGIGKGEAINPQHKQRT